jgi:hypothetical protein
MKDSTALPARYSKTPTPLPEAPRTIWIPSETMMTLWGLRLIVLPLLILIGIPIVVCAILMDGCALFGSPVTGAVVSVKIEHGENSDSYKAEYEFQVDGRNLSDTQDISAEGYQTLKGAIKKPVVVWYFAFGSWWDSKLPGFEREAPWILPLLVTFFAVMWASIVCLMFYFFFFHLREICNTYRHGEVAIGTVLSKEDKSDEADIFFFTFAFTDRDGRQFVREIRTDSIGRFGPGVGDPITVIYNPACPGRLSFAYEIGDVFINGAGARSLWVNCT